MIPFIIFTGKGREEVAVEALNLGADHYINKIGKPETVYGELAHGIRQLVKVRQAEEKLRNIEKFLRERKGEMRTQALSYLIGNLFEAKSLDDCLDVAIKGLRMLGFFQSQISLLEDGYFVVKRNHMDKKSQFLLEKIGGVKFLGHKTDATTSFNTHLLDSKVVTTIDIKHTVRIRLEDFIREYLPKEWGRGRRFGIVKRVVSVIPKRIDLLILPLNIRGDVIGAVGISTPSIVLGDVRFMKNLCELFAQAFERVQREVERKKAELELGNSAAYLDMMGDALMVLSPDAKLIKVNRAFSKIWGYSHEEILGKSVFELFTQEETPKHRIEMEAAAKTGTSRVFETIALTKNRERIPVSVNGILLRDTRGKPLNFIASFRDITERKEAEEDLKESKEMYERVVELAPDSIVTFTKKGVITACNMAATRMLGFSRDELVNKHFAKVGVFNTRDVPKYLKLLYSVVRGKVTKPVEIKFNRKDGTSFWAEVHVAPIKKGDKTIGFQSISRDTTERRKMKDKLDVVGRLTRHDARNKLSAVTMNAFLAKQKLAHDSEALQHLSEIESACGDVRKIFEFAEIYEKMGVEELAYVNVEKTLEETVRLFSNSQGAKVVNDCRGLTLLADSLLRQLFYNLIDNSLKHGEKVSRIRVHFQDVGKDQLNLVYEDNGIGILKREKKKIFKEGYGKGTGYGLYLMRKMCDVYGWTIQETGKQGKGAQFTITIPRLGQDGKENYRIK
jgi:PAS domain S-box-containing protein